MVAAVFFKIYRPTNKNLWGAFLAIYILGVLPCQPSNSEGEAIDTDKVLVIMIYDDKCKKWCNVVRPLLGEVKQEYGDKIALHELDVSEKSLGKTMDTAKQLGVCSFVKGVLDWVPTVGIFTAKRQLIKELPGVTKREVIEKSINKALSSK